MGGSLGRLEATGFGLVFALREALKELAFPRTAPPQASRDSATSPKRRPVFEQLGGRVVCVSCWDQKAGVSYAFKKEPHRIQALAGITDRFGGIDREKAAKMGYEVSSRRGLASQNVDILIPAAVENRSRMRMCRPSDPESG